MAYGTINASVINGLTQAAPGGATVTSSGSGITLTASSTQVQEVAFTAANQTVTLPDATTVTNTGGAIFVITNNGTYSFDIVASGGYNIFTLLSGQTAILSLVGNTGQYQWVSCLSSNSNIVLAKSPNTSISATATTAQGFNNQGFVVSALSTSTVLAVWINSSNGYIYASVGTISGLTISWGTVTAISTATAYGIISVAPLSSTTALISAGATTGTATFFAWGVSISGSTITVSTRGGGYPSNVVPQGALQLFPVTSTTAIATVQDSNFQAGSGSGCTARVLTYNGASAPTGGSAIGLTYANNVQNSNVYLAPLTATTFLVVSNNGSTWGAAVLTVSGTTVTQGTYVALSNSGGASGFTSNANALIVISSTEAIFSTSSSNTIQRLTISGTTVTVSTLFTVLSNPNLNLLSLPSNAGYLPLMSSTDFIGAVGTNGNLLARYSYNSTAGVTSKGSTQVQMMTYPFSYCYVTTNTAVVVGLDINNLPTGAVVTLQN